MITADSQIKQVVMNNPDIAEVFEDYNIKVVGWGGMAKYHIGDVADFKDIDLDSLLEDLNNFQKE